MIARQIKRSVPRRHLGYSLLEMVLSLTVLSMAFAAVGSVFVLAARVTPGPGTAEASAVEQSAALSQLIEDLQVARYITEDTANSVTMVVDDRTGDGLPDRLRYAWSGTTGDPLTLSINGSTPIDIAGNVQAFNLSFTTADRVDSVAGAPGVSQEVLLYGHTSATNPTGRNINWNQQTGQLINPALPTSATTYRITRVRFRAKSSGASNGETHIRIRGVDGSLPNSTIHSEETLLESTLTNSMAWVDVNFAAPVDQPAGTATALTLEWISNVNSATIEIDTGGGAGLLTVDSKGDPWAHQAAQGMLVEVYGTYTAVSPDVELTTTHNTAAQVTLQVGGANAQTADTKMYREPGVHSAQWDAGFGASPVGVDMDGNGADWSSTSGGAAWAFTDGRWSVDGQLETAAINTFLEPITVDLVMGAANKNRNGSMFQINADQAGGQAIVLLVTASQDSACQHIVRVYTGTDQVLQLEATDLGENLPRVRLLIAPADNAVGLIVNGVPIGTFTYTPVSSSGLPGVATISEVSDGVFDEVSIRVGGTAAVTAGTAP